VRATLEAAAAAGVNHVQLSHDLIMNIDEVLGEGPDVQSRVDTLNLAILLAHQHGMEAWIWVHELSEQPPVVCYGPDSALWGERAAAYREGLARLPGVDGVVLMFGSAPMPPWFTLCTCDWCLEPEGATPLTYPTQADRVRLITEQIGDVVVRELGRKLIARVFVHEPQENAWHADGLAAVRTVDFTAMHKGTVQDWQPYNPFDPTLGHAGPHPAVVELDLAGEYWGLSELPFCAPGYFRHLLRHAAANHGIGAVSRVQRGSHSALGTPNEVNVRAVAALLADPERSLASIWTDFVQARYGVGPGAASDALAGVLADTFPIRLKSHYALGIWALEKGSDFPRSASFEELDGRGAMPKWDADWQDIWDRLHRPDRATLLELWQEGSEAVELARAAEARFEGMRPLLSEADAADLGRRLLHQRLAAEGWRAVDLLLFGREALQTGSADADVPAWTAWARAEVARVRDELNAAGFAGAVSGSPGALAALYDATATVVPRETPAAAPPGPVFGPLRVLAAGAGTARLEVTTSVEADVTLDWGRELPDYGQTLELGVVGPGAPREIELTGLGRRERHVARVRTTVAGVAWRSGEAWIFTE
jgi:hypothetical protein